MAATHQDIYFQVMATRLSANFQILQTAVSECNEKFGCAIKVYVKDNASVILQLKQGTMSDADHDNLIEDISQYIMEKYDTGHIVFFSDTVEEFEKAQSCELSTLLGSEYVDVIVSSPLLRPSDTLSGVE